MISPTRRFGRSPSTWHHRGMPVDVADEQVHDPAAPSRRRRWIAILAVVALLAAPLAVLLSIRAQGVAEWERVVADLEARGEIVDLGDALERAPAVDVELQERWFRWQRDLEATVELDDFEFSPEAWLLGREGEGDSRRRSELAARHGTFMADGIEMLADPRLITSAWGFIERDLRRASAPVSPLDLSGPDLISTRMMLRWAAWLAFEQDERERALMIFDRLDAAADPPATVIGVMILVAARVERDRSYLLLAWQDRLPDAAFAAWLAEAGAGARWADAGLDGERGMYLMPLYHQAAGLDRDGPAVEPLGDGPLASGPDFLHWLYGPRDAAHLVRRLGDIERVLAGEIDEMPAIVGRASWARDPYAHMLLLDRSAYLTTLFDTETSSRLSRLAVRVLRAARAGEPLPADENAFDHRFPDARRAGVLHAPLRYERLGPDRFRLAVDPSGPSPHWYEGGYAFSTSRLGSPPATESFHIDAGSIELTTSSP